MPVVDKHPWNLVSENKLLKVINNEAAALLSTTKSSFPSLKGLVFDNSLFAVYDQCMTWFTHWIFVANDFCYDQQQ